VAARLIDTAPTITAWRCVIELPDLDAKILGVLSFEF